MKQYFFILLFFLVLSGKSQTFEYQVLFEGIGDNREYFSNMAYPQTILGSRGAFELGVAMDNHRIRGGLSMLYEFGTDISFNTPLLTLYYQFSNEHKQFVFGAFPRRDRIDFPLAMLTDTLLYYRPNIEGMFGEVNWDWGKQNAFIDWVSLRTETQRETFMAGLSGEIFYKNLFLQNYILLSHDRAPINSLPGDNIKDHMGFALQLGIRTSKESKLEGYLKAGILGSAYRERNVTEGFLNATSLFAEAKGRIHNFGLKTVLSSGAGQRFAYGDLFYRAKNYLRTDAIWYFINQNNIKGTFNWSLHVIDWNDIDQQQQLSIIYVFGI